MIELDDFPGDVSILIEDDFRAKFFKTVWMEKGGYRKLAKEFGVTTTAMLGWRRALYPDRSQSFCPAWVVKKISKILFDRGHEQFNIQNVQSNIISYRAKHGLLIHGPILPIQDSIQLRQFVMHLVCDGTAQNISHRTCKYDSTSIEAVREFRDILKIFGNIEREITTQNRKFPFKTAFRVSFPKSIAKILINKFGTMDGKEARIPKEFFAGDRNLLISVVRAFLIDEGHIRDTRITFTSANTKLLRDLIQICEKLGYVCCKIRKTWTAFEFSLSSKSLQQVYNDIMQIGPLPINDKQKRLEFAFYLQNSNGKNFREIEQNIIRLLSEGPLTNVELSHRLLVRARTIWSRLKTLEGQGKIKGAKIAGNHGAYIYELI